MSVLTFILYNTLFGLLLGSQLEGKSFTVLDTVLKMDELKQFQIIFTSQNVAIKYCNTFYTAY